ncbi:MAG: arginase family protein [Acidobacteriota bacterium]
MVQRIRPGLFGCPSVIENDLQSDFTFLGAPLDFGNHRGAGTRGGPASVRGRSLEGYRHYRIDEDTGQPAGFFDNDLERPLLTGARLADAGDLFVAPSQSPASVFANLRTLVREIRGSGSTPVVLGGDHSLTYPVLEAIDQPVRIIHVDAHTDLAAYYEGAEHHHGNFMTRALNLDHVVSVCQIGIRNTTSECQTARSGKIQQVTSVRQLRRVGLSQSVDQWRETSRRANEDSHACYLTFDIDSLEPSVAPGTTTPVPGGFLFDEAKDLLALLGAEFDFVGCDFVEVNPDRDPSGVTEIVALELMLAFLGAQFDRRARRQRTH